MIEEVRQRAEQLIRELQANAAAAGLEIRLAVVKDPRLRRCHWFYADWDGQRMIESGESADPVTLRETFTQRIAR